MCCATSPIEAVVKCNSARHDVQDARRLTAVSDRHHVKLCRIQEDSGVEMLAGADAGIGPVKNTRTFPDVVYELRHRRRAEAGARSGAEQGWAIVPNEGIIGFNALAVPVLDANASLAAILGVIGATRSLPANPPSDLVKALTRAGETISSALGYATERGRIKPTGWQRRW
jgi:hypothetical protein